jgi:fucose permease
MGIKLVIFGFLTLLLSAFIDNIRGPLLVPMLQTLGLTLSGGGLFLGVSHIGAALASLLLLRLQKTATDRGILLGAFAVTVLVGGVALLTSGPLTLVLLALLTGFVITSLGTMCNILVILGSPKQLLGKILSGLHGMYGVGSYLGTITVGQLLSLSMPWYMAYAVASLCGFGMLILIATQFPGQSTSGTAPAQRFGNPRWAHLLVVATFAFYVGSEVSMIMWMPAFLTQSKGLSPAEGAQYASYFFLVLTATRLGCAFFVRPGFEKHLAIACLMASFGFFWYAFFFDYRFIALTGLLGPFYPLFFSMVSQTFRVSWRIMTTLIMLGVNGFVGITNYSIGQLSDVYGVALAYRSGPILLVGTAILLATYFISEKRLAE